jgi:hypothetical protein
MPDQRRTFPINRGGVTAIKQVFTKQLGTARGGGVNEPYSSRVTGAPSSPLMPERSISSAGRDSKMD